MLQSWAINTLASFTLIYRALTWPVPSFTSYTPAIYPTPTPTPNLICEFIGPTHALPQFNPTLKPTSPRIFPSVHINPTKNPPPPLNLNALVNQYRANLHLSQLDSKDDLCHLSQDRLNEIATSFNHDGFRHLIDTGVFSALGFTAYAENIWQGNGNPESAISSWILSSGHKANLEGDYQYGCGLFAQNQAVYLFAR